MSVAVIPMAKELGWSAMERGLVSSSFFWGYSLTQIPAGWVSTRCVWCVCVRVRVWMDGGWGWGRECVAWRCHPCKFASLLGCLGGLPANGVRLIILCGPLGAEGRPWAVLGLPALLLPQDRKLQSCVEA